MGTNDSYRGCFEGPNFRLPQPRRETLALNSAVLTTAKTRDLSPQRPELPAAPRAQLPAWLSFAKEAFTYTALRSVPPSTGSLPLPPPSPRHWFFVNAFRQATNAKIYQHFSSPLSDQSLNDVSTLAAH